jgi:LDH2 family malate/lactate/ureidoglycolate dehydrogenase
MDNRTWVSWEKIEEVMVKAVVKVGVPLEDAKLCADVLMESDRRGIESHGVNRFKPIYIDRIMAGIQ